MLVKTFTFVMATERGLWLAQSFSPSGVFERMLLNPRTGNQEPGTGNGEQDSGNERSAVFHIKIQNGGRENSPVEKRTTQVAKSTANLS